MPYLTEEDLIGPFEEAAELQSVLGVEVMRRELDAPPPPQIQLEFGGVDTREQHIEGDTVTAHASSTTSATSGTEQALEQPSHADADTPSDSSTSSSQEQDITTNSSGGPGSTTSSPSTPSTPQKSRSTKRKTTTTSSPRPRSATKRKSRTFEDDDDEYRAPSTPRTKARRSGVIAKADDDDEEYGPPRFASRTMTRQVRRGTRYSDPFPYANEDPEAHSICLDACKRPEDENMLACSGACEKKFHAQCVGFRMVLPEGRKWLCFECRKERKLGMRTNGVVEEGNEGDLVEVQRGSRMEEEWRRDGWMV